MFYFEKECLLQVLDWNEIVSVKKNTLEHLLAYWTVMSFLKLH